MASYNKHRLAAGERLYPGEGITSVDGRWRLVYQHDGHVVVYHEASSAPVWGSERFSPSPGWLEMQGDGNLVAYDAGGAFYWATMTHGAPEGASWLELAQDGAPEIRMTVTRWRGTPSLPPTIPVPPEGPTTPPPVLGVGDRWLTQGGGDFDYREASAMAIYWRLQREGEAVIREDLARWRALRVTHLRLFGMLGADYWVRRGITYGPAEGDGFFERTARLLDLIGEAGLGARYAIFCDAGDLVRSAVARRAHAGRVGAILASRPWVIAEVANEPTLNGFDGEAGFAQLKELAEVVRGAGSKIVGLGAHHGAQGHLPGYAVPPANVVSFHAERRLGYGGWEWVKRLGEYAVIANEAGMPAISGEPTNADTECPDPAIWAAYGALSRIVLTKGYLPCVHSDQGLVGLPPTGIVAECLAAFNQGCDAVPLSVRYAPWVNGHWSESPFRGYAQTDPPSGDRPYRIFGRGTGAGNYLGVALRAPRGWSWPDLRYPVALAAEIGRGDFVTQVWRAR